MATYDMLTRLPYSGARHSCGQPSRRPAGLTRCTRVRFLGPVRLRSSRCPGRWSRQRRDLGLAAAQQPRRRTSTSEIAGPGCCGGRDRPRTVVGFTGHACRGHGADTQGRRSRPTSGPGADPVSKRPRGVRSLAASSPSTRPAVQVGGRGRVDRPRSRPGAPQHSARCRPPHLPSMGHRPAAGRGRREVPITERGRSIGGRPTRCPTMDGA